MLLSNKNAVITGSNRGIGKKIVEIFAQQGANIWACARQPSQDVIDEMNTLAEKNNISIRWLYFDLNDSVKMKEAISTIKKEKISIDILVNNAGVIQTSLFSMTSITSMKDLFATNFFSQLEFTQYIIKLMAKSPAASIINLSSSAAIEGNEGRISYSASKAALIAATKVLSKEFGQQNIRVNAIAPGLTQTEMMEQSTPENIIEKTLSRICLQRIGAPQEIANVALFLASDLSSYITGQTIRVDGGM